MAGHGASHHVVDLAGVGGHSLLYENTLIALLSISAGLVFLDRLGIIYVFPQIQHELGLSHAQLGMLMGINAVTWAISSIIVSFVSDGLGVRAKLIIVLCLVGFSCATGMIAITASYGALLTVRAIAGLFFGPALPLIMSVAAKSSSPHRVGANVGAVGAGMVLMGTAVTPMLVTLLAGAFGWHLAFVYIALPGFLLALVLAVVIKPDVPISGGASSGSDRVRLRDSIGLLMNRNIALAVVGGLAMISFQVTFPSFSPLFLGQDQTMPVSTRTILLTVMGLASGIGNFVVPMLSDRFRRKTCAIVASCCVMLVPAMLILVREHHGVIPLFLAVQFVAGGALPMLVFVIPSESVPRRVAATAFALPLSIGELFGGSTTPGIAGAISDHHGLTSVMWFCCGLGALGLVAASGMREPPRRDDVAEGLPHGLVAEGVAL